MIKSITQLKGKFLLASPMISNEEFDKSIILMTEVNFYNSFGFIISQDEELENIALKNTQFENEPIYYGGSANEDRLFLLHSSEKIWKNSLKINEFVYATNLKEISKNDEIPKNFKIVAGHVQWKEGILEHEIAKGNWLYVEFDFSTLFKPSKMKWQKTLNKMNLDPYHFSSVVGIS